jgi:hypothetical protein
MNKGNQALMEFACRVLTYLFRGEGRGRIMKERNENSVNIM